MSFEVWAPRASAVSLELAGNVTPMRASAGGWWASDQPWSPDLDYGYHLDGGDLRPDPRSLRQPEGVHGPSRTFAPAPMIEWPGRELHGGVIYELHIGTFTPSGTLDSAIERLDHLVDLGIDFVEILPVNAFNGTHNWGYDGVLWYAVQETYGGPAAYQRFVDACHVRGLAVVQDVVYNHLGPSGNYLPEFGRYLDDASSNTWGDTVNLDGPESEEVRRYIIDNALMWLRDYHVDALRLDAVHALLDAGETHLLKELASEVDALAADLGRPLTLIAESDLNDPKLITPRTDGGYGLTAQWSDDYHHAAHVALSGETTGYYSDFDSLAALGKVMTKGFFHDGTFSSFRERDHGVPIDLERMPTWRLVTFTQDHDQIGNRATGDRLSQTLDANSLGLEAVLTVLTPFTPMIFMGEEWGATTPWQFFTSHPEPDLGKATAEGRIAEFEKMGWDPDVVPDPQDPATFANSKLDWSEATEAPLLELYRSLIALRRSTPALTDPAFGSVRCAWDEAERWFRMDRDGVSVVLNFAPEPRLVEVHGLSDVLLATEPGPRIDGTGILVPARGAVVVGTHD